MGRGRPQVAVLVADFGGVLLFVSTALEHFHRHTSYGNAVVMEQGCTATQHVAATPPSVVGQPAPLPPNCRVPRGQGVGGVAIFVRYYVDDGILVEQQM